MLYQAVLSSLLALGQGVSALPAKSKLSARQGTGTTPPPMNLPTYYCPRLDYSEPVDGPKWQTGNSAPSGASLSINTGYSQGTTWTVGADLGLSIENILKGVSGSGGVSFSYSETVTKTITIGSSLNCPKRKDDSEADYDCSLLVTPGFVKMGGEVVEMYPGDTNCDFGMSTEPGKWEIIVPRLDSGDNPFYHADKCLCEGDGQDDENAPELKCLEKCTGGSS